MPLTTLDPRTALVVIDLQEGILGMETEPHTASDVLERSVRLAEAFRARDLPVVLVRVSFGDSQQSPPGRTDAAQGGGAARSFPQGWDRVSGDLLRDGDLVVTKRNWGAFHGTDLDVLLRRRGVTQIVLTGVATSAGVESTARAAHEHGYHVTLVTDAMADRSATTHAHSTEQIFPRLGETGTTQDVLSLLERSHG